MKKLAVLIFLYLSLPLIAKDKNIVYPSVFIEEKTTVFLDTIPKKQADADDSKIVLRGRIYIKNSKEALAGVSVLIKGTTMGTVSDVDGYYEIHIPVSMVRYRKVTILYEFVRSRTQKFVIKSDEKNQIKDVYIRINSPWIW